MDHEYMCKVCGWTGGGCQEKEPEPFEYKPGETAELIDSMAEVIRQRSVVIIEGLYSHKDHEVGYRIMTEMRGPQLIEKRHIKPKLRV